MLSTNDAIEYLVTHIPELKDTLYDDKDLVYMQMGAFAKYTQHYIDTGDRKNTAFCFKIASTILRDGCPDVKNAIAVSYCEHLNFHDKKKMRSWAKAIMPPILLQTYNDVNAYLDRIFKK